MVFCSFLSHPLPSLLAPPTRSHMPYRPLLDSLPHSTIPPSLDSLLLAWLTLPVISKEVACVVRPLHNRKLFAYKINLNGRWAMVSLICKQRPLRTFARQFSNIDFFSEHFSIQRWWVSDVRNVKEWGGQRLRLGEDMPGRTPQSE